MTTTMLDEDLQQPPPQPGRDVRYEYFDGQFVEKVMGAWQVSLANQLHLYFAMFLQAHPLGKAFVGMPYRLRRTTRLERIPDFSFVPISRWPDRVVPDCSAWAIIPSLAVEIVSETNSTEEVRGRIADCFGNGVNTAWMVYPRLRQIYVLDSLTSGRILTDQDTLDGGPFLPEFRLPVSQWLG